MGRFDIWGLISQEDKEHSSTSRAIEISPVREVKIKETKKTYLVNLSNHRISDYFIVMDKIGKGKVDEISLKASGDYKVIFELDGETLYNDNISDLAAESDDIENLVAVSREGNYIFGLSDFYFLKNAKLIVRVTSRTTFSKLYAKCLVEEPDGGKQRTSL